MAAPWGFTPPTKKKKNTKFQLEMRQNARFMCWNHIQTFRSRSSHMVHPFQTTTKTYRYPSIHPSIVCGFLNEIEKCRFLSLVTLFIRLGSPPTPGPFSTFVCKRITIHGSKTSNAHSFCSAFPSSLFFLSIYFLILLLGFCNIVDHLLCRTTTTTNYWYAAFVLVSAGWAASVRFVSLVILLSHRIVFKQHHFFFTVRLFKSFEWQFYAKSRRTLCCFYTFFFLLFCFVL